MCETFKNIKSFNNINLTQYKSFKLVECDCDDLPKDLINLKSLDLVNCLNVKKETLETYINLEILNINNCDLNELPKIRKLDVLYIDNNKYIKEIPDFYKYFYSFGLNNSCEISFPKNIIIDSFSLHNDRYIKSINDIKNIKELYLSGFSCLYLKDIINNLKKYENKNTIKLYINCKRYNIYGGYNDYMNYCLNKNNDIEKFAFD